MRKKTLDGLVKLADWQATVSERTWQNQLELRDQALREQETVKQYIAAYNKVIAGDECLPVMLAHKRMFISKLSDQLTQLDEHVIDCGNRLDDASVKHRSDTQKVVALRLLLDSELHRANLKMRRHEQAEQDEVASRSPLSGSQVTELGSYDYV